MTPALALLTAAVLALWLAPRHRLWLVLGAATLVTGLATGGLDPIALIPVAALGFAAWRAGDLSTRAVPVPWLLVLLAVSAGLMLHIWPGFHNVRILHDERLTSDARPYSLYLNLDKTLIGLIVLGFCLPRAQTLTDWRDLLRRAAPWAAGLIALLVAVSYAAGYVRFDPKWPSVGLLWAGANLLSTCTAEEAIFRGVVQTQWRQRWRHRATRDWVPLLGASILFGVAHAGGGLTYVLLATVAGVGYGWVYQRTGRIEASILTHFALNAVHFFLFTYPALEQPSSVGAP